MEMTARGVFSETQRDQGLKDSTTDSPWDGPYVFIYPWVVMGYLPSTHKPSV